MVWKGLDPMEFNIEDIVSSSNIQLGDTIVTGGMSSFFPYGIPLGTIAELDKDSDSGYFIVTAKLFQNPSQIYNAYVIENNFKEEIELLNKEEGQ
jgi:rod shape-determining protein MreC